QNARFTPDGSTVVYSASWDGEPLQLHLESPASTEDTPLKLPSANLLGFPSAGEVALALDCKPSHRGLCSGTLARAPLLGSATPREMVEGIQEAEWTSAGDAAVVRDLSKETRIEMLSGKELY